MVTRATPWITGMSRDETASIAAVPSPGMPNTRSTITVPPSSTVAWSPIVVTTGSGGVLDGVLADDQASGQALHAGRPHVVELERVAERGPGLAADLGGRGQPEGERRKHEVAERTRRGPRRTARSPTTGTSRG